MKRPFSLLGVAFLELAEDDRRVMTVPEQIDSVADFEFGESGRDPNFPHGWYLVPGIVAATGLLLGAIALWM